MERKNLNRIKQVIIEHKSTGRALAAYLRRHPNSVSKWSLNQSQPSVPDLFTIAFYYNVDVRDLLIPTPPKAGIESPCEKDNNNKPPRTRMPKKSPPKKNNKRNRK